MGVEAPGPPERHRNGAAGRSVERARGLVWSSLGLERSSSSSCGGCSSGAGGSRAGSPGGGPLGAGAGVGPSPVPTGAPVSYMPPYANPSIISNSNQFFSGAPMHAPLTPMPMYHHPMHSMPHQSMPQMHHAPTRTAPSVAPVAIAATPLLDPTTVLVRGYQERTGGGHIAGIRGRGWSL